ncbi:class I SAM-dependent methyltransferase [Heyndrickxia ginsengihumi]|uniref:Class I SAM-dependent methyltransferase n=1 Tax=Heyndrickxia ginsengihumi TaxID=363870 RepID=A0A0A6VGP8_9BACI|nr:class I SAM-dependent methyltransferase [Heyndrickxia ginsengihumi]KHD86623.1 hypothetical protein NG54_02025 [Heyndrickxia ginsengihumi]MBE6184999.1 class I SAM-dependent methyltransferase [Bacillus sp. (in: firmicutes)]MCM3022661.1 class I SAM-dependent methyltransferase [Heyndrickxia ginsengihumi]NEY19000.1 class I SAM-dependent methyltransferase [Heyndrickxia ginsengihumi]
MPIDFHNEDNRSTYSSREADISWTKKILKICEVKDKKVLDMGCGGGIYSKAFAHMGAASVTGIDFSQQLLSSARENCKSYANIHFYLGDVLNTRLEEKQYDIILSRAVIHHLSDLNSCFSEIFRLLKPDGICLIQDRTPEDCLLEGSPTHIRGYFFAKYPSLINKEISRRYTSNVVTQALQTVGFDDIEEHYLWETRKKYTSKEELTADLLNRTGRSILHELNDKQLKALVEYIQLHLNNNEEIIEKDRWTIWKAIKM